MFLNLSKHWKFITINGCELYSRLCTRYNLCDLWWSVLDTAVYDLWWSVLDTIYVICGEVYSIQSMWFVVKCTRYNICDLWWSVLDAIYVICGEVYSIQSMWFVVKCTRYSFMWFVVRCTPYSCMRNLWIRFAWVVGCACTFEMSMVFTHGHWFLSPIKWTAKIKLIVESYPRSHLPLSPKSIRARVAQWVK
jgi:hypothetical protein